MRKGTDKNKNLQLIKSSNDQGTQKSRNHESDCERVQKNVMMIIPAAQLSVLFFDKKKSSI